jgi:hypothetical protein
MSKEEILKILEDAKDKNSDVPMRLVRQALEKLPEPCEDAVSRQWLLDEYDKRHKGTAGGARKIIEEAPSVHSEHYGDCTRCKHQPRFSREEPCVYCSNNYENKWSQKNG